MMPSDVRFHCRAGQALACFARVLSLLALSLLLHLLLLQWALQQPWKGLGNEACAMMPLQVTPVTMLLLAANPAPIPASQSAPLSKPKPKPAKKPIPKRATARVAPPKPSKAAAPKPPNSIAAPALDTLAHANANAIIAADTAILPVPVPMPIDDPKAPLADAVEPAAATDIGADTPSENSADVPEIAEAANLPVPAAPRIDVDLPPSATLSYEVRYATRGTITHGSGVIVWQASQTGYAIQGEISKFGFTLTSFRSDGNVDAGGIAPRLYGEKNARRAEATTRFQRDASQTIVFSNNDTSTPLVPGAQDRASILWQLAGIARAQDNALIAGAKLDILVAGVREAEHWQIDILGEQTTEIESGPIRAWHLVRMPGAQSSGSGSGSGSDKRIDIWLAPERNWYPVKLRYTEVSGDYLELSLAAVH